MGKRLYIGGLPFSATDETLFQLFAQHGKVESAEVVTDRYSGSSRGFGFVEMGSDEEAAAAVRGMNGAELDGRYLTVEEARSARGDRGGGGGGGGGPRRDGGGGGGGGGGDRGGGGGGGGPRRW